MLLGTRRGYELGARHGRGARGGCARGMRARVGQRGERSAWARARGGAGVRGDHFRCRARWRPGLGARGTVPSALAGSENAPSPGSGGPTPQAALRRYALVYTNWQASTLGAHERRLASLGVGAARLAALQTAASASGAVSLVADHVQNRGVVLAVAPGQGPGHGQWVVVTQEQTTGTGAYAGLPASTHVTLGRVTHVSDEWVVSEWSPSD